MKAMPLKTLDVLHICFVHTIGFAYGRHDRVLILYLISGVRKTRQRYEYILLLMTRDPLGTHTHARAKKKKKINPELVE